MKTATVVGTLFVWLVVAASAVAAGFLRRVPVPPPAIVVPLAALTAGVMLSTRAGRAWMTAADLRWFLAVHLVRFVGVAFLVLVSRGVLSPAFTPVGWGDAIAAAGAVVLLVARPSETTRRGWWSIFAWNVFGAADMLMLVVTGVRVGRVSPEQFALFRELPFGLLPTFFVPLIIATHVLIFVRLCAARSRRNL